MTLVAKDEAGQEGRSAPFELTLPARHFSNPLARALVEQRATLAMNANAADRVAGALDALTLVPEQGIADTKNYLAVRAAYYRLVNAYDDEDLRGVVDYLWAVALGIEDGGVSLAADQLRAAEDALRKALENNASDEEIARLTQQLRDAMQKYLQALADQMQKNPQSLTQQIDPNAKVLNSADLQKMLDRIEELAKTGARDAARQLLSQLQNMMENMQAGQMPNSDNPNSQAMAQSLDKLGDLIRRQEQLMNKTYNAERGQNDDGKPMSRAGAGRPPEAASGRPAGPRPTRSRNFRSSSKAWAFSRRQARRRRSGDGPRRRPARQPEPGLGRRRAEQRPRPAPPGRARASPSSLRSRGRDWAWAWRWA